MEPYIVKRSLEHYIENVQQVKILKAKHAVLRDKYDNMSSGGSTPKIPEGTPMSRDVKLANMISNIDETLKSIKHLEYEISVAEKFLEIIRGRDYDLICAKYAQNKPFSDLSIEYNCSKSYLFNEIDRIVAKNSHLIEN
jgi:hypothetical protein